jgi:hypothetical protein
MTVAHVTPSCLFPVSLSDKKDRPEAGSLDVLSQFFVHFFRGKFGGKFLGNFPLKMSGQIGIFHGKSFEKSFPQEIPRKILRKITFCGKNVRTIGPNQTIVSLTSSFRSV